jgi:electron transport complex protein RnfE
MSRLAIFMKGIVRENPVLVLILGICPVLAVSTSFFDALGLGVATTFVLIGSNVAISLLRRVIPNKVRIPCYIVLIAAFVALVQMILEAYAFPLHQALGIFLPLIAVNCVIFARAEMFANKNVIFNSIIDALGMGIGFTLAIMLIAAIRESLGEGTLTLLNLGEGMRVVVDLPVLSDFNVSIFTMAPGGFIVFGVVIAVINKISKGNAVKKKEFTCANCPAAVACGKAVAK